MFASPAEFRKDACIRTAFRYLLLTVFCALFGAVYEMFSHGVYAYGMLYAFAFPLLGGALPYLMLAKSKRRYPPDAAQLLWHFGISALTVGSIFSGALKIYGTASRLTAAYWLAGGVCLLLSLLTTLFVPAVLSPSN